MSEFLNYIFGYALDVTIFFIVGIAFFKLWEWIQKAK